MITYDVFQDAKFPQEWRVEGIDKERGEIYITVFAGPDSEKRAKRYANWAQDGRKQCIVCEGTGNLDEVLVPHDEIFASNLSNKELRNRLIAVLMERDAAKAKASILIRALGKIKDVDAETTECKCDHTIPECCAVVGFPCVTCAIAFLLGKIDPSLQGAEGQETGK